MANENIKSEKINVPRNNKNKDSIETLLDRFPLEFREKINVVIANHFQEEKKINRKELYRSALEKGYCFNVFDNIYIQCEASLMNANVIRPDGRVTSCDSFAEQGTYYGKLEKGGEISLNENMYYKLKNISPLDSEKCRECNLLPMCNGGCPRKRYNDKNFCIGRHFDGMSVEDIIDLHIDYDIRNNKVPVDSYI